MRSSPNAFLLSEIAGNQSVKSVKLQYKDKCNSGIYAASNNTECGKSYKYVVYLFLLFMSSFLDTI